MPQRGATSLHIFQTSLLQSISNPYRRLGRHTPWSLTYLCVFVKCTTVAKHSIKLCFYPIRRKTRKNKYMRTTSLFLRVAAAQILPLPPQTGEANTSTEETRTRRAWEISSPIPTEFVTLGMQRYPNWSSPASRLVFHCVCYII